MIPAAEGWLHVNYPKPPLKALHGHLQELRSECCALRVQFAYWFLVDHKGIFYIEIIFR